MKFKTLATATYLASALATNAIAQDDSLVIGKKLDQILAENKDKIVTEENNSFCEEAKIVGKYLVAVCGTEKPRTLEPIVIGSLNYKGKEYPLGSFEMRLEDKGANSMDERDPIRPNESDVIHTRYIGPKQMIRRLLEINDKNGEPKKGEEWEHIGYERQHNEAHVRIFKWWERLLANKIMPGKIKSLYSKILELPKSRTENSTTERQYRETEEEIDGLKGLLEGTYTKKVDQCTHPLGEKVQITPYAGILKK